MSKTESKESLFVRLTKLFRNAPLVRRKIRNTDTTIAVPDKLRSSGVMLFQKSISPTYATITSNAYNIAERLMRYQDFQEMEQCLIGSTKIAVPCGFVTLEELTERCDKDPDYKFIVYSYDHEKHQLVPTFGKQARQTCVDDAYRVTFDNGQTITGNASHRLMLRDGSYRVIADLKPGDSMMPFYRKDLFEGAKEGTKGYSWIYTMNSRFQGWTKEHQLIAEFVADRELAEDEVVHHVNFVKTDNRPENLKIMNKLDHDSFHAMINNGVKWSPENSEWIEGFKKNHAVMMRDNNPVRRNDVTFGLILQTCDQIGYDWHRLLSTLGVSASVITNRLCEKGFKNFSTFAKAYKDGHKTQEHDNSVTLGLLTRDLSIDMIKSVMTPEDTGGSVCIKLGCSTRVLSKFLNKQAKITWNDLRKSMGYPIKSRSYNKQNRCPLTFQQVCDAYETGISLPHLAVKLGVTKNTILSRLNQQGMTKYGDYVQYQNHKVISVEYVGKVPLYDITVDGYKNFATDSVVSHNTAEICSALNIFADETMAQDDKGRSLQIYSSDERISGHLHDLFYGSLNIDFNGRPMARNLCKFGDTFYLNDVSPQYGIENMYAIPVNEIEREENYDRERPFAHRFRWTTLGNKTLEAWEVSHFRMLGSDQFLPYGSSVLEGARRIWRQLILSEDAMLVYRVVRAPDRRVFYIDVGNIPESDIPDYVEETKRRMKSSQVIDQSTGRVDARYNPMCFSRDVKIPLLDGRVLSIEELVNEWNLGRRDQETYSLDLENGGKIVPGKIIWAGKSGQTTQFAEITLDDGTVMRVTPDHKMISRTGELVKAKDLKFGDSLMPAYFSYGSMTNGVTDPGSKHVYERIFEPATGRMQFVHRCIASQKYNLRLTVGGFLAIGGYTVHHVNFDKRNNSTTNLELMLTSEHSAYHAALAKNNIIAYNKSEKHRVRTTEVNKQLKKAEHMGAVYNGTELHKSHNENRRQGQKKAWNERRQERSDAMCFKWSLECQALVIDRVKRLTKFVSQHDFIVALRDDVEFFATYAAVNSHLKRDPKKSFHKGIVGQFIKQDYLDWKSVVAANNPHILGRKFVNNVDASNIACDSKNNHKVTSVVIVDVQSEDVYNVTVDKWHNLAVGSPTAQKLDVEKNESVGFLMVQQSVDEDFYLPIRNSQSGTKIESLPGGTNAAAVEDVEYLQKKLFAAIQIPRAFLGYDESLSSKSTLAQLDIKFSRTVNTIQKTIISELNKAAIIHLFCNGFTGDELLDFTLRMPNPSTIAEQQKLELWRTRFDVASSAPEGLVTKGFIRREIFSLNTEQSAQLDKEREYEKIIDAKVEAAGSGGGDESEGPFGSGGGGGGSSPGLGGGGEESTPEGGEEASTEAPPEATPEEAPPENAEEEHGVQLLTNADEPRAERGSVPIKANNAVSREKYNASRRRHHGPASTEMPDLNNAADSRKMDVDPFDSNWMHSFAKMSEAREVDEHVHEKKLNKTTLTMLREMSTALHASPEKKVLTESDEVDLQLDDETIYDR